MIDCYSLKQDGYYVKAADWKPNEFMEASEFCDEFEVLDLRQLDNCIKVQKVERFSLLSQVKK